MLYTLFSVIRIPHDRIQTIDKGEALLNQCHQEHCDSCTYVAYESPVKRIIGYWARNIPIKNWLTMSLCYSFHLCKTKTLTSLAYVKQTEKRQKQTDVKKVKKLNWQIKIILEQADHQKLWQKGKVNYCTKNK